MVGHSPQELRTVTLACQLHRDNPAECPQAHICKCGARLNEHRTVMAYCPKGIGKGFRPDRETLAAFPEQYAKIGLTESSPRPETGTGNT